MKISSSWHQEEARTMLRQQSLVLTGLSRSALSETCHFHSKGTTFAARNRIQNINEKRKLRHKPSNQNPDLQARVYSNQIIWCAKKNHLNEHSNHIYMYINEPHRLKIF